MLRTHVRALVAAIIAGGVGWLALLAAPDVASLTGWSGFATAVLVTCAGGAIMLVAYAGMLKVMRVSEVDEAIAPVMRRWRRR